MTDNSMFTTGPFVSASLSIQGAAAGLYSAALLIESIRSEEKYEQQLQEAIDRELGEDEIALRQREVDYYRGLLDITIASLTYGDEMEQ